MNGGIQSLLPWIMAASLGGVLGGSLLLGRVLLEEGRRRRGQMERKGEGNRGVRWGRFHQDLYRLLGALPPTRRLLLEIRTQLSILHSGSERNLRHSAASLALKVYGGLLLLWVLFALLAGEPHLLALFIPLTWFLGETVADYFVVRLQNRLLHQHIHFNERLRQRYYECGTVDEALYEVCGNAGKDMELMAIQGQRILEVLQSKEPEREMEAYNETAPNNYLKMLLGLCFLTMEYGDVAVGGQSGFMRNLGTLSDELRMEAGKRERLNYALKSLHGIILLPLFCIGPVKGWAGENFRPLEVFYASPQGFLFECLLLVLVGAAFVALRKIQQLESRRLPPPGHVPLEERLLGGRLKGLLLPFVPPAGSPGGRRLHQKLSDSLSPLSYENYQVRRMLVAILFFLGAASVLGGMKAVAVRNVWNAPTLETGFLGGSLGEEALAEAREATAFDSGWLQRPESASLESLVPALAGATGLDPREASVLGLRILAKRRTLDGLGLAWEELLLVLGVGLLGYRMPDLWLFFSERVRRMEMEEEVAGFSTIILMLMHHPRVSVLELLEWMELFSFNFKNSLMGCLNDASHGLDTALDRLQEGSGCGPFTHLVERLRMAEDGLAIAQAFESLEVEKHYELVRRKEANNRMVERKIALGQTIGFLPVYGLILLYMIVPMVGSSIREMDTYFQQLMG
ncbi:hypothetical protein [Anaerotalea alkaliphila]|uniref:Uncharacterized protein n=1 Tax=Anaerotalea alkaliphila TaxID=2662126 RepID=A0A7X5HTH3_9FIRM|nr:hypothetical protein [Anaerotalea alkaliphila]NDL66380.1 hypothetical protein [Anaerotalea alkaliphila]